MINKLGQKVWALWHSSYQFAHAPAQPLLQFHTLYTTAQVTAQVSAGLPCGSCNTLAINTNTSPCAAQDSAFLAQGRRAVCKYECLVKAEDH